MMFRFVVESLLKIVWLYGHVYFVLLSKIGHRGTFSVSIIWLIKSIIRLTNGIIRLIIGIFRLLNGIIRLITGIIRLINP